MSASAAVPYVHGRSPPAGVDDETLVLLLGVLNLAGLFLYSAYNFVQDRPRLRSTYDRYVDAQVRRVLDDLVMRVHQTAYFSDLLETARTAGRALGGPAVAHMDFDRLEALSEGFPFPAPPGRQLAWLRRLNVTAEERTTLAGALPLLSALRQLPTGLRRGLRELAQPQPALAGHQQRAYAGLLRLVSELWPSGIVTPVDARQLRFYKTKWRKKPLTAKQEAALRKKGIAFESSEELYEDPVYEDEDLPTGEDTPLEDAAGYNEGYGEGYSGEVWTGSHWTDRWYQLASQVTPVLLDAGNGYALSRRRPHCLPAVVCRLNRDWKPHGAVKASLSPLASLLLGWWLQDLGAGITLEDTLVAVRAGWMQRSCADLYPRCHAVRGTEPPPPPPEPQQEYHHAPVNADARIDTITTPAPVATGTTPEPHGFFWALSTLLKKPPPRPPRPVDRRPEPPTPSTTTSSPTPSTTSPTTTSLPPVIVGRLPPAASGGREPLSALDGEGVDWGGAPPLEPPPDIPHVDLAGWDRHQAVAWNRLDLGGSGGPPWDQFGGHGGGPIRGRPREVAHVSFLRPERRNEQQEQQQQQQQQYTEQQQSQPQSEQWPEQEPEEILRQEHTPDHRPDLRPDYGSDYRPNFDPDHRPDQRLDHDQDHRPDQRPDFDPEHRPDFGPDQIPDQRLEYGQNQHPDHGSDHGQEHNDSAPAPSDQQPAANAHDTYQGGHLIPSALLALRRRPYQPSRRGYVSEYGSDVLSGVQQSYAAGGAAPTEATATTYRPGLVLDAPAPVQQLLPGRYRLGLRRGLASGDAHGVLPAYAERRRGLQLMPAVPTMPAMPSVQPATSPEPRRRWTQPPPPEPTAATPGGERRRTWVQFGPQDGVTDAEKHRNLYSYVRDRSVRRLWGHG